MINIGKWIKEFPDLSIAFFVYKSEYLSQLKQNVHLGVPINILPIGYWYLNREKLRPMDEIIHTHLILFRLPFSHSAKLMQAVYYLLFIEAHTKSHISTSKSTDIFESTSFPHVTGKYLSL